MPQRNTKQLLSSITDHLITIGHVVDRSISCTMVHTDQNTHFLKFAEAAANSLERPFQCNQKDNNTAGTHVMGEGGKQGACRMKSSKRGCKLVVPFG